MLLGAFLLWAVANISAPRRRDLEVGTRYPVGTPARDAAVLVVGLATWALFACLLHRWLIGVRPFG